MLGKRSYDDPCGVARALDLVGERWALLVVRELLFGPKRFADLSRGLPAMSQNVLSQRLSELERAAIVRRRRLGPPASTRVYELTERGSELEPILHALARWGSRVPLAATTELSVDAFVLALKTTFEPVAAAGLDARYELRLGDDRFQAEISGGHFQIARGASSEPDAILDSDVTSLRSVVFGGRPLEDAVLAGALHLDGNHAAAARFAACFPRPVSSDTLAVTN
jgi:DNA-binding HxlR family transcriptional regulator